MLCQLRSANVGESVMLCSRRVPPMSSKEGCPVKERLMFALSLASVPTLLVATVAFAESSPAVVD